MNIKKLFTIFTTFIFVFIAVFPVNLVLASPNNEEDRTGNNTAAEWPTVFTPYTDSSGNPIFDPGADVNPIDVDITSGVDRGVGNLPSFYVASDDDNFFVRLRLKGDLYDRKGGFLSSVWLVKIADEEGHKATIGVNGKSPHLDYVYVANADGTVVNMIYKTPTSGGNAVPGTRIVSAENGHYFLDFQVPISEVSHVAPSITPTTPVKLFFGTSKAANLSVINKEYMNTGNNGGSMTSFSGLQPISLSHPVLNPILPTPPATITIDSMSGNKNGDGHFTSNGITVTGTVSVNENITIEINGSTREVTPTEVNGVYSWTTNLSTSPALIANETGIYTLIASVENNGVTAKTTSQFEVLLTGTTDRLAIDGGYVAVTEIARPTLTGVFETTKQGNNFRIYVDIVDKDGVAIITSEATKNTTTKTWTYAVPGDLVPGINFVRVRMQSSNGNTTYSTTNQQLTYSPTGGTVVKPLFVSIESVMPAGNATPVISGESTGAKTVEVQINGTTIQIVEPAADGTWSMEALERPLPTGTHTIRAIEINEEGNKVVIATREHNVTETSISIDNGEEVVTNDNRPMIRGNTNATNGSEVAVAIGSAGSFTGTVNNGRWMIEVPDSSPVIEDGSHTVTASVSGVSASPQQLTIDTTTEVAISTPINGSTTQEVRPIISGTAEAGATIDLRVVKKNVPNDVIFVQSLVATDGTWSCTPNHDMVQDEYTVIAIASDLYGNEAIATSDFTIATTTSSSIESVSPITRTVAFGTSVEAARAELPSEVTVNLVGGGTAQVPITWSATSTPAYDGNVSASYVFEGTFGALPNGVNNDNNIVAPTGTVTVTAQGKTAAPVVSGPVRAGDIAISGTSEPNATIKVMRDNQEIGTATADGSGNWSVSFHEGVTLSENDELKVTAKTEGKAESDEATVTVQLALSDAKEIVTYSVPGQIGQATINSENGTIAIEVATGTDLANLVATFTLSDLAQGATIGGVTQTSETTGNDFTSPVTYVVTAENGSTKSWIVTVTAQGKTAAPVVTGSIRAGDTTISGTSEPNATIKVMRENQEIGTATADGSGNWSVSFYEGVTLSENDDLKFIATASGKAESEVTSVIVTDIPAPKIKGSTDENRTVMVTGVISGAIVILYDKDGNEVGRTIAEGENATFPNVPGGIDYYVTQTVDGVTSAPSNKINVVEIFGSVDGARTVKVVGATPGSTVRLYDKNGNLVEEKEANSDGEFIFTSVEPNVDYYVTQKTGKEESNPSNKVNVLPRIEVRYSKDTKGIPEIWESVTLPIFLVAEQSEEQISWTSDKPHIISIGTNMVVEEGQVFPEYKATISRQDEDVNVILTAKVKKDGEYFNRTFLLVVKGIGANESKVTEPSTNAVKIGGEPQTTNVDQTINVTRTALTRNGVTQNIDKMRIISPIVGSGGTVVIEIDDTPIGEDRADEITADVVFDALKEMTTKPLTLKTPEGSITLPTSSLTEASNRGIDLFFRIVPVRTEQGKSEVVERTRNEMQAHAGQGKRVTVLDIPREIYTNYTGIDTEITLPLTNVNIPTSGVNALRVFIEHSDGQKRIVEPGDGPLDGKFEYTNGSDQPPTGFTFSIAKFSTFTFFEVGDQPASSGGGGGYTPTPQVEFTGMIGTGQNTIEIEYNQAIGSFNKDGLTVIVNGEELEIEDVIVINDDKRIVITLKESLPQGEDIYVHYDFQKGGVNDKLQLLNMYKIQKVNFHTAYIKGFPDGTFKPENNVTRAQMAAIVARFKDFTVIEVTQGTFTDNSNYWATGIIEANRNSGILDGYEDGSFRPNRNLTRAEASKVVNRMFDRGPLYGMKKSSWPDATPTHWAYHEIEEASQDHYYTIRTEGGENIVVR